MKVIHDLFEGCSACFFSPLLILLTVSAVNAADPKIAVTDLSYEEKVREYVHNFEMNEKHSHSSSGSSSYRDSDFSSSGRSSGRVSDSGSLSIKSSSGYQTYIDRGEFRKFTADIKGELLKSGYRVVQGKPWVQNNTEKLYDIISRIKQGYYPGADYVLWGSINSIDFRQDVTPLQGSNAVSYILSLELVGEFSLINTKTYEVRAAFSAQGEGADTKMVNAPGARISFNRGKVVQEVSRSLGQAVASEVESQFSNRNVSTRGESFYSHQESSESNEGKVTIFR